MENQNRDNVWFHDRFFTEAVYNPDEQVREEIRRFAQGFPTAHIIFYDASEEELEDRGSKDAWRHDRIARRYEKLMDAVGSYDVIDTGKLSIEEAVVETIDSVQQAHDPDAERPHFPG